MTVLRHTSFRTAPALALGGGFYGMCFVAVAYTAVVLRNFDPLFGDPVNVVVIVMLYMFGPAVVMLFGAIATSAFVPRVIGQHQRRLLVIGFLVGLADYWLLIGLLELRKWLQDSLIKPSDVESYIIALVVAFLIGASTYWLVARVAVGLGGLQELGAQGERCDQCGYDLRGGVAGSKKCPECGASVSSAPLG